MLLFMKYLTGRNANNRVNRRSEMPKRSASRKKNVLDDSIIENVAKYGYMIYVRTIHNNRARDNNMTNSHMSRANRRIPDAPFTLCNVNPRFRIPILLMKSIR